jgi:hypothetical protein
MTYKNAISTPILLIHGVKVAYNNGLSSEISDL